MKKQLLSLLLLVIGLPVVSGQTLLTEIPAYKIQFGDMQDVDVNADGKLDLFIGGNDFAKSEVNERIGLDGTSYYYQTIMLIWSKTQQEFYEAGTNFKSNSRPYATFADMDGDNVLDIVYSHHGVIAAFPDDYGVFIGDGNGNFDKEEWTFDNQNYEFFPKASAVADFNMDGKPDVLAIGHVGTPGSPDFVNHSAVLIHDGEYVGDLKFKVTNQDLFANHSWSYPQIQVLDFNNDGYPDFLLTARDASDNAINNGTFTDIFVNKGESAPGEFKRLFLCEQMEAVPQYLGPLLVQDFNGDGYLDIFITGKNANTSVSPMNLYLNNGNGTFSKSTQSNFRADMRNENSTASQSKAFDWDGDGIPDIIISGYVSEAPATQTGFWWKNDGQAAFGAESRLPGASNSCMAFPDWNGDGVRDMMIVGKTTSTTYITQGGSNYFEAMITKGEAPVNAKPSAPANINAVVGGNSVTLSWDAAVDDKTPSNSLSYEFFIMNSDGEVYNDCRSIIGGADDGSRMVLALGNAFLNKSIKINNLPDDDYTWGVQAIDASYAGSVFATGSFKIDGSSSVPQTRELDVKIAVHNHTLTLMTKAESATLTIMDATGKVLEKSNFTGKYSKEFQKGVYLLSVEQNGLRKIRKVMI
ncbi:hypothetical protein MASR2M117_15540 [Paludibacter sp.]